MKVNLFNFNFVCTPRDMGITGLCLLLKLKDCLTLAHDSLKSDTCLSFLLSEKKIHSGVLFVFSSMQKHTPGAHLQGHWLSCHVIEELRVSEKAKHA